MYGGGFSQADRSPLPITPELIKQLEKEDEELFLRWEQVTFDRTRELRIE